MGGQAATMADAPIGVDFDEPLYVLAGLLPQLSLNREVPINVLSDSGYLVVGEIFDLGLEVNPCVTTNVGGGFWSQTVNVPEGDIYAFAPRYIYSCYTSHDSLSLASVYGERSDRLHERRLCAALSCIYHSASLLMLELSFLLQYGYDILSSLLEAVGDSSAVKIIGRQFH